MKWSYCKVFGWFVALSFVSLVAYIHMVMASVRPVASSPGEMFAIALLAFLTAVLSAVWRHNRSVYPRAFAQWGRSFVCLKCGAISE
jgi:high-affinity Fe2+/Pb2+ permease